jgi:hypothetical protein
MHLPDYREVVVSRTLNAHFRTSQCAESATHTAQPVDEAATDSDRRPWTHAGGHPRSLGSAYEVVDVGLDQKVFVSMVHVVLPLVDASTISAPSAQSAADTSAA